MRVGLVGWGTRTGLGYLHREMWDLGLVQRWLVPRHPKLGIEAIMTPPEAIPCNRSGQDAVYAHFLDDIDVLLFCERPVLEGFDLVSEARRRRIPVVCIPMMEWLPNPLKTAWVRRVHMMWAPTQAAKRALTKIAVDMRQRQQPCDWEAHILGGRWGVNLARFPFQERTVCRQFLFCNGYGGAEQRKGLGVLAEAARQVPQARILVLSQTSQLPMLPANCEVRISNIEQPTALYHHGDVFVAPSRFEGLGLPLYEAQASGLPVITTDGPPMNECRPAWRIPATPGEVVLHSGRVTSYEADPLELASLLRKLHEQPVQQESQLARQHMQQQFDLAQTVQQLQEAFQRLKAKPVTTATVGKSVPRQTSLRHAHKRIPPKRR